MEKSSWFHIIRRSPEWGLWIFLILTVTFFGAVSREGRFSVGSMWTALRSLITTGHVPHTTATAQADSEANSPN